MLGEEEIPTSAITNKVMKRNSYSDKVMSTAILNLKKNKL